MLILTLVMMISMIIVMILTRNGNVQWGIRLITNGDFDDEYDDDHNDLKDDHDDFDDDHDDFDPAT